MQIDNKGISRICYFGTYSMEEGYPRNRVIIEGLRRNGVEVTECHEDFWKDTAEKLEGVKAGYVKILSRLLLAYVSLIKKFGQAGSYDALVVGYAGHIDIFLAKVLNLFGRKPIIFDAFLSLYDTAVVDRMIVPHGSFKAKLLRLVDTWACRMADAVLLDTQAHVDYFVREFHLPAEKFYAVPVGSSLALQPSSSSSSNSPLFQNGDKGDFTVLYFGSYIPLHGVDVILKAAKIIQEEGGAGIVFTLVGKGQMLAEMQDLASSLGLKNINFVDRFVKEEELGRYIQEADVCLGIFGRTDKAQRVIPCKVYNCLAMGKPLITGMTPAMDGVLAHKENAFLCRPDDPLSLSDAICDLKNDETLRRKIGCGGHRYFEENFSVDVIGKKVLNIVESL